MIKVIHKALNILEYLSAKPEGESLSAIAAHIGEKPTTVSNIVQVLAKRNYLERADGRWKLGVSAYMLTGSVQDYDRVLYSKAQPILQRLSAETAATVTLTMWRGLERYALLRVSDDSAVTVNRHYPEANDVYRTPTGIVLLAEQPEETIDAYIAANGVPGSKAPTQEEIAGFKEKLCQQKKAGLCARANDVVFEAAVPVHDVSGRVRTAIGLYLPLFRANDREELVSAMLRAAKELEIGFERPGTI